jgi:hypothetical protein
VVVVEGFPPEPVATTPASVVVVLGEVVREGPGDGSEVTELPGAVVDSGTVVVVVGIGGTEVLGTVVVRSGTVVKMSLVRVGRPREIVVVGREI